MTASEFFQLSNATTDNPIIVWSVTNQHTEVSHHLALESQDEEEADVMCACICLENFSLRD